MRSEQCAAGVGGGGRGVMGDRRWISIYNLITASEENALSRHLRQFQDMPLTLTLPIMLTIIDILIDC